MYPLGKHLPSTSTSHPLIIPSLVRLLAHAGFDPRHAVRFWEERNEQNERTAECTPKHATETIASERQWEQSVPMRWMGSTHPYNVTRVEKLKEELRRWDRKREEARKKVVVEDREEQS